jgi:hypothetical protein
MDNRNTDEKTVARHARLNNSRLHGPVLFAVLLMAITLLALTVSSQPANAVDELYLTGTIKSINASTGIVTVNVTSSSCRGMRIFKADKLEKLEEYVEQNISFFIDSDKCAVKDIYTIITARGLRK